MNKRKIGIQRKVGITAAAFAVGLLLLGALTTSWWRADSPGSSIGMGLTGLQSCVAKLCSSRSYEQFGTEPDRAFVTFGAMLYYGAFVLSGVLALSLAAAKRSLKGPLSPPISPARVTVLLGLMLLMIAVAFILIRPEFGPYPRPQMHFGLRIGAELSIGFSLPAFITGAVLGMFGAHLLSITDE